MHYDQKKSWLIFFLLSFIFTQASIRDRNGNTPLHLACRNGDLACVQDIVVPPKQSEFESRKAHAVFLSSLNMEEWNYEGKLEKKIKSIKSFLTN
jgi:hypothetical protein